MNFWKIALAAALLPMPALAATEDFDIFTQQSWSLEQQAPHDHQGHHHRHYRSYDPADTGIHQAVTRAAEAYGLPPALAHGIVRVESNYRCGARNGSARGIMQVQSRTARGVGISGNLMSCQTGLEAGMRYLRMAYQKARGNWCSAASLYNQGLFGSTRCSHYGRMVLARAG